MKNLTTFAIVATTLICNGAKADEDIKWSAALKVWDAALSQPDNHNGMQMHTSASSSAGNIAITAKKGDYFVTASALLPTSYDYGSGNYLHRNDTDLAFGWHFSESFSVLIGQKRISYIDGTVGAQQQAINSTYAGLSGAKLISDRGFIYGTLIYGLHTKNSGDQPSSNYKESMDAEEIGYGYALDKTTQLTVGYKIQHVNSHYNPQNIDFNSSVGGVIFGANFNFN